jgi:predicted nucleotidyltransferase
MDESPYSHREITMAAPSDKLLEALDIQRILFAKYKINYALIGGLALGYLGNARFTKDVDLLLKVPQITLPRLLEDLIEKGFELDLMHAIRQWTQGNMLVMHYETFRIDWLKPPLDLHAHVIETATEETWKGTNLKVATPESMILLKLIAFRENDKADIEGLIANFREKLKLDYIHTEWQTIGDLTDPQMVWFQQRYQHITSGGR